MRVVTTAGEMSRISAEAHAAGRKIAFVPTMGALHEGHLALFREGRRRGDLSVASIFVNPRQFNDPEDFRKYARDLAGDLKKCESEGVDAVFTPDEGEIYPPNDPGPAVPLPPTAFPLEGRSRPGHFEGVVAVVSRLFRIVRPDLAVFGQKDYQQLRVIEEMVKGEGLGIEIVRHPTVREPDGLAMSSRNARLSPEGRRKAVLLPQALKAAAYLHKNGERSPGKIREPIRQAFEREAVRIDYVAIVDAVTLQEIPRLDRPAVVAIAAFVEGVRLIDNCLLGKAE